MPIEAWYMDDSNEDQRLPHKTDPVEPVPLADLAALGVLSWSGIKVVIQPTYNLLTISLGS